MLARTLTQLVSKYRFVVIAFVVWRLLLFIPQLVALRVLPTSGDFLGGGKHLYESLPLFWSWLNFDGEHYLALAREGYQPLTYFFFPAYPIVINTVAGVIGRSIDIYAIVGLVVSHCAFIVGLIGMYKLTMEQLGIKIARVSLLIMLAFPTSFYFAAYYTESLFFALIVWSFYLSTHKHTVWAFILAGISGATRLVGIVVPISMILTEIKWRPKFIAPNLKRLLIYSSGFVGIIMYMVYLWTKTSTPLAFMQSVEIFGAQRSSQLVFLPQVFYRYIVKVLPNVSLSYFPAAFAAWLEFVIAVLFLTIIVYACIKRVVPHRFLVFAALGYLLPPLSGSFSSFPRYVIVLFPVFWVLAQLYNRMPKYAYVVAFGVSIALLTIALALFTRGYFVS